MHGPGTEAAAIRAMGRPGLAAVKVELDVEGLPAPPLPDDAPGRAGPPSEMNAELRSEQHHAAQVKVEIKTEVKSESSERKRPGDRRATRAPVSH